MATITISVRAASPPGSVTPTGPAGGIRGATGRSATAASSRRRTKSSGMARTSPRSSTRSPARSWRCSPIAWRATSFRANRARVAGLLCALYPGLIIYSALVMTEPLSALALVIAGWCWVRYRRDRPLLGGSALRARDRARHARSPESSRLCTCSSSSRGRHPLRVASPRRAEARDRARRDLHGVRVSPGPSVDDPQLPRDGPLHVGLDQRRMEPRHRKLRSSDRSIRNASILGRLRGGDRSGPAGRLLARRRAKNHSQRSRAMARPRPEEARLHVRPRVVPGRIPPRSRSRSLA